MPEPIKALLLAGGLGTRLRPLTDGIPKCMVPIGGRPLLDYWFDRFEFAGISEILINTHHHPEVVREHIVRTNNCRRIQVRETYEPVLLGSAGTVHSNRAWADGARIVLIVYADNLSDVDLSQMVAFHINGGSPLTMMLFRSQCPERCGIAQLDGGGWVTEFVEKPSQPKGNLANGGIYALTADAYRKVADMDGFDLGFDILPRFVGRMRGWLWEGYHRDIGTHESLAQAEKDVSHVFGLSGRQP